MRQLLIFTCMPKKPHDEILAVLNSIIEFAFKGDIKDKICVK